MRTQPNPNGYHLLFSNWTKCVCACVTYVLLSYYYSIVMMPLTMVDHYHSPNMLNPMNSDVRVVAFANFCSSISSIRNHLVALAPTLQHSHSNCLLMVRDLMRPTLIRLVVLNVSYKHNLIHSNRPYNVGSLMHLVYSNSVTGMAPCSGERKRRRKKARKTQKILMRHSMMMQSIGR